MKGIKLQILSADQGQDSSGGTNHDMRSCFWVLQKLNVIINWDTTVESGTSDLLEVFCESIEFLLDLIGELSGVAQDEGGSWFWVSFINLVQDGEDKDSGLTHA